ncbi:hypothetical protein LOS78_21380 (plasmid) [Paracoccus sp. MA]|uniref:hypothetical protein n=1 Tax=Paracoccus sp. MA TaxID=2895796 RepID=UPI001E5F6413|nr:hypothetical protein [Paracoccus sp. MA]UFM67496.1 hypothetical protein LOS78_21380 [Paracoccus sp. MA]
MPDFRRRLQRRNAAEEIALGQHLAHQQDRACLDDAVGRRHPGIHEKGIDHMHGLNRAPSPKGGQRTGQQDRTRHRQRADEDLADRLLQLVKGQPCGLRQVARGPAGDEAEGGALEQGPPASCSSCEMAR